jgi:hypothetical protein
MRLKCDWKGCKNPAFAEVDWDDEDGKWYWSNLCFPHFFLEQYIHGKELGWLLSQVWYSHFWNSVWKVSHKIIP